MMASGRHGTLYIGVTSNLVGRVMQHREGAFEGFSKRYSCNRLVWFAVADTMEAAIGREKQMKKWNRDWKARLIEEDNPEWEDLAIGLGLPPLQAGVARHSEQARLDSRLRGNDEERLR
jgi:putative endonuclease